jgi:hypothetical protein
MNTATSIQSARQVTIAASSNYSVHTTTSIGRQPRATPRNAHMRRTSLTAAPDNTQLIAAIPLPVRGWDILAAFYSPEASPSPRPTLSAVSSDSASEHMSRAALQRDENCRELLDLHFLIGTIFAYSNRCLRPSTNSIEVAAGFRYFLPNGRLAYEWIRFFDIAPSHYLAMAPPQVLQAYHMEGTTLEPSSMRGWVNDVVKQRDAQEAGEFFQQQVALNHTASDLIDPFMLQLDAAYLSTQVAPPAPTSKPVSSKRKAETSLLEDLDDQDPIQQGDARPRLPEAKRPRLEASIDMALLAAHPALVSTGTSRYVRASSRTVSSGPQVQAPRGASVPVAPTRSAPAIKRVASAAPPSQGAVPSRAQRLAPPNGQGYQAPAISTTPMPVAHPVSIAPAIPVPAVQQTPVAHQLLPGGPVLATVSGNLHLQLQPGFQPRLDRRPVKQLARDHPVPAQVPGSVKHSGKGNPMKAWSAERCRAFTDIQGYPLSELPQTYNSQYGDELSRDHTPKSIDPRHCPFDTTMEELLTVGSCNKDIDG